MNHNCPHCNSTNMTVDINICITGKLETDGTIHCKEHWTPSNITEDLIASASEEDISGFCNDCGKECNFSWEKGFFLPTKKQIERTQP